MNVFMGWNIIFQCHCILYNFNHLKFLSLLHGKMAKTSSLLVKLERYDVLVGWGSRVMRGLFSLPNRHALSKSFPGRHGRGLNCHLPSDLRTNGLGRHSQVSSVCLHCQKEWNISVPWVIGHPRLASSIPCGHLGQTTASSFLTAQSLLSSKLSPFYWMLVSRESKSGPRQFDGNHFQ